MYYLRNILHDWSDDLSKKILTELRAAMDPKSSKILINEIVVPARGVSSRYAPRSDLNMMSLAAGVERTEAQWKELVESVGLKIEKVWTPADDANESVIEVVVDKVA